MFAFLLRRVQFTPTLKSNTSSPLREKCCNQRARNKLLDNRIGWIWSMLWHHQWQFYDFERFFFRIFWFWLKFWPVFRFRKDSNVPPHVALFGRVILTISCRRASGLAIIFSNLFDLYALIIVVYWLKMKINGMIIFIK